MLARVKLTFKKLEKVALPYSLWNAENGISAFGMAAPPPSFPYFAEEAG